MFLENTPTPWQHGALKFYLREGDVNDVLVENLDIVEPTYAGIEFRGFGTAYVPPGERFHPGVLSAAESAKLANVTLRHVRVVRPATYGIEVKDGGGRGQVAFDDVQIIELLPDALGRAGLVGAMLASGDASVPPRLLLARGLCASAGERGADR